MPRKIVLHTVNGLNGFRFVRKTLMQHKSSEIYADGFLIQSFYAKKIN